jgi:hypothetical protein
MTAKDLLSLNEKVLEKAIKAGDYKEITEEKHEEVSR